jgi:hypothetical protein
MVSIYQNNLFHELMGVGRQQAILQPRQIVVAVCWATSRARKTSNQTTSHHELGPRSFRFWRDMGSSQSLPDLRRYIRIRTMQGNLQGDTAIAGGN